MRLLDTIQRFLDKNGASHLQELYAAIPEMKRHSIRARIYEHLGTRFRRMGKGVYVAVHGDASCVLVAGDAWDEMKKIGSESIDCLLTDPPYPWLHSILEIHTTTRRRMRWDFEKRDIDATLGLEIYRVLRKGAHAFFFVPAESAATKPHIDGLIGRLERCGLVFNKRFIWDRQRLGMGYNGRARYEGILFMSKGRRRRPCDLSVPDLLTEKAVPPAKRVHETEKPLGLLERLIRFATKPRETVLDCFAGSCSTGVAALSTGRNALLIEKRIS